MLYVCDIVDVHKESNGSSDITSSQVSKCLRLSVTSLWHDGGRGYRYSIIIGRSEVTNQYGTVSETGTNQPFFPVFGREIIRSLPRSLVVAMEGKEGTGLRPVRVHGPFEISDNGQKKPRNGNLDDQLPRDVTARSCMYR